MLFSDGLACWLGCSVTLPRSVTQHVPGPRDRSKREGWVGTWLSRWPGPVQSLCVLLGQQPQGCLLQGEAICSPGPWVEGRLGRRTPAALGQGPGGEGGRAMWGAWGLARDPGPVTWPEGGQTAILGPQGASGLPWPLSPTPDAPGAATWPGGSGTTPGGSERELPAQGWWGGQPAPPPIHSVSLWTSQPAVVPIGFVILPQGCAERRSPASWHPLHCPEIFSESNPSSPFSLPRSSGSSASSLISSGP